MVDEFRKAEDHEDPAAHHAGDERRQRAHLHDPQSRVPVLRFAKPRPEGT
jgi:hypothetical protein